VVSVTPEQVKAFNDEKNAERKLASLQQGMCLDNPYCWCPAILVDREAQRCECPCHNPDESVI
jgi:hypothetical protein